MPIHLTAKNREDSIAQTWEQVLLEQEFEDCLLLGVSLLGFKGSPDFILLVQFFLYIFHLSRVLFCLFHENRFLIEHSLHVLHIHFHLLLLLLFQLILLCFLSLQFLLEVNYFHRSHFLLLNLSLLLLFLLDLLARHQIEVIPLHMMISSHLQRILR